MKFIYILTALGVCFLFTIASKGQKTDNNILLTNSVKHSFSDPIKEDIFRLTINGDSLFNAKVLFEIIDFKKKRIYIDSFTTNDLLGFATDWLNTPAEKSDYIKKRVDSFFSKENFYIPAIPSNQRKDTDNTDLKKEIWNELKSDPKRVGFYYLVGEENGTRIAYSRKLKRVVIYFTCC